jgi:phage gpG-like protein
MFEIKMDDAEVQAKLGAVKAKLGNLKPVMAEIGEELIENVKKRFETSTGPDGQAWAPNKESTLLGMLKQTKGNFKKAGKNAQYMGGRALSAKGSRRSGGKKPLIGESKALSSTISYKPSADQLEIGSGLIYSRVQQQGAGKGAFGKTKRNSPIPWGDIPARPYLGFSDEDRSMILDVLESYLTP